MPYKNEEDARAYGKALYEANKESRKAYSKDWYESNKEKAAATRSAWYQRNREDLIVYAKANAKANRKRKTAMAKIYRKDNPEKFAAMNKKYYEKNKSLALALGAKRRALKLKLIPKHLKKCPVEKQRVLDIYKLRSLISKATGIKHHVDHMWPLSDGGPHWSGNLQIITAHDNLTKNASVDLELKYNIQQSLKETM